MELILGLNGERQYTISYTTLQELHVFGCQDFERVGWVIRDHTS